MSKIDSGFARFSTGFDYEGFWTLRYEWSQWRLAVAGNRAKFYSNKGDALKVMARFVRAKNSFALHKVTSFVDYFQFATPCWLGGAQLELWREGYSF